MTSKKSTLYWPPAVTVDTVIFSIQENDLQVLLIKRSEGPFKNRYALPGGFIVRNEPSKDAVSRILKDKAGVKGVYTEQLYTFDNLGRDPRGHVLTVVYVALARPATLKVDVNNHEHPQLFPARKLPSLAFDHKKIITYALHRLRTKLEYTDIVCSLLPDEFTMPQLQHTYEIILGKNLDKRNFVKKFLSRDMVKSIPKKLSGPRRHPAQLYRFTSRKHEIL